MTKSEWESLLLNNKWTITNWSTYNSVFTAEKNFKVVVGYVNKDTYQENGTIKNGLTERVEK